MKCKRCGCKMHYGDQFDSHNTRDECIRALQVERDYLVEALRAIVRGDYDNAHDCTNAAKFAKQQLEVIVP